MPGPRIAITAGDVAGIGPEIVARALADQRVTAACTPVVCCHPVILQRAFQHCEIEPPGLRSVSRWPDGDVSVAANELLCINPAGDRALVAAAGQVSADSGDAAFQYLETAIQLAQAGHIEAIATAPLNKAALHAAGHHFPGHTEILADRFGVSSFAMMLHLPESRLAPLRNLLGSFDGQSHHGVSIAHVTLHTSVKSVPGLLRSNDIADRVHLMDEFLQRIGSHRRAIAVCALNPHGGESGLFGDEEARIIDPAVKHAQAAGSNVVGPLPVDTLIRRAFMGEFDGVIAMYHDQGHIPVKLIAFDAAVNITLGLPIVRTSPTHGTAFDRAWNAGTPADASGMIEAILTAVKLSSGSSRS